MVCFQKIFSWIDPGSRQRLQMKQGPYDPFPSVHQHVLMLLFLTQGASPFCLGSSESNGCWSGVITPQIFSNPGNSYSHLGSISPRQQKYFSVLEVLLCFSLSLFLFLIFFLSLHVLFCFFFLAASRSLCSLESWKSDVGIMSPIFAFSTGRAPTGSLRWFQFILTLVVVFVCLME